MSTTIEIRFRKNKKLKILLKSFKKYLFVYYRFEICIKIKNKSNYTATV